MERTGGRHRAPEKAVRAGRDGRSRRLSKRSAKTATLPEILDWQGKEPTEAGISRKEALGVWLWEQALEGTRWVIELLFDYLASKPAQRISSEVELQAMPPFTADEAAEAVRGLEAEIGDCGWRSAD